MIINSPANPPVEIPKSGKITKVVQSSSVYIIQNGTFQSSNFTFTSGSMTENIGAALALLYYNQPFSFLNNENFILANFYFYALRQSGSAGNTSVARSMVSSEIVQTSFGSKLGSSLSFTFSDSFSSIIGFNLNSIKTGSYIGLFLTVKDFALSSASDTSSLVLGNFKSAYLKWEILYWSES